MVEAETSRRSRYPWYPVRPVQIFWLASASCAVLGLTAAAALSTWIGVDAEIGGGKHDGYWEIAKNLAAGYGFVFEPGGPAVFHRPPLYPLLLVPVALLPEPVQRVALTLFQAGLVGVTAMCTFAIARSFSGLGVARVAAALVALNPWVIWLTRNPLSSIAQMCLFTLCCYLALLWWRGGTGLGRHRFFRSPWSFGVSLGALALSHGAMLFPVAVLLVALLARAPRGLRARVVAAALVATACVVPWTARNWLETGRLIPVAGNAGIVYFLGNAHWRLHEPEPNSPLSVQDRTLRHAGINTHAAETLHYWGTLDPDLDALAQQHMLSDIAEHGSDFLLKVTLNAIEYYFPVLHPAVRARDRGLSAVTNVGSEDTAGKTLRSAYYLLLWSAAVVGLAYSSQRWFLLGAIALYALPHLPFAVRHQSSLYNLGTLPFLSIAVAEGLWVLRAAFGATSIYSADVSRSSG